MKHRFLTPEWFSSYDDLCTAAAPAAVGAQAPVNLRVADEAGVVTDVHLVGSLVKAGPSNEADTSIDTTFDVAYAMLISGDGAAVMKAFASGGLRVDGDITRLMAMAASGAHPDVQAFQSRVREMTA